ncbi:MAG: acetyl-CoA carboxylase biotin carboxyl carrier protein subunit, partial [Candidatus Dependentiae bacterium]
TIDDITHTLQILRWEPVSGELVCSLGQTVYRWRRLTPLHETPVTWYSYQHDATITLHTQRPRTQKKSNNSSTSSDGPLITSPLAGRVIRVLTKEKDCVEAKTPLVVIEAMKMENEIRAPYDGFVETVFIKPEDVVEVGQSLITLNRKEE